LNPYFNFHFCLFFQSLDAVSQELKDDESSQSYPQKDLEIFIEFKYKHAIAKIFRNGKNGDTHEEKLILQWEKVTKHHTKNEKRKGA
jgi:hypothetical protein